MRIPTKEMQFLQTLGKRKTLDFAEKKALARLKKGFNGEVWLDDLQAQLSKGPIPCLDDFAISTGKKSVQIDKLLVANGVAYVVDVKNYQGQYKLENNEWYCNGVLLQQNIMEQLHNAVRAIKRLFRQENIHLKVAGVLVFVGDGANIVLPDDVTDKILSGKAISQWLLDLSWQVCPNDWILWQDVIKKEMLPPYPCDRVCDEAVNKRLRKGILCRRCGGQNLMETSYNMVCLNCHEKEPKETAYTRTVCDCGVLFHDQDLTFRLLREFFGKGLNERYLQEMLGKHFKVAAFAGRRSTYTNKEFAFEYWFADELEYFAKLEVKTKWKSRN